MMAWPRDIILTWALDHVPAHLSRTNIWLAFHLATTWWSDVCGVVFQPTTDLTTALITVTFGPIDGPGGQIAWSDNIDCTVKRRLSKYDEAEDWTLSDDPEPDGVDFTRTAAHELGHLLGIPHLDAGNLMHGQYGRVRKPQAGDIAEAVARYGPPKKS